jgi:hypothetical protein
MWQMLIAIVSGLGLLLALPARAEEKAGPGKDPDGKALQVVEIMGRLHHVKGTLPGNPSLPFDYWGLLAGGKTYPLDFHDQKLLGLAEKLDGQTVEVIGIRTPSSQSIRVTGFRYALVEIRGKLRKTSRPLDCRDVITMTPEQPAFPPSRQPRWDPFRELTLVWTITTGGKTYDLDFGSNDLQKLAETLEGKPVVVTGTPRKYAIHVTGMKAEESATATEKVTTEVQGQIRRLKIANARGDEYERWGLTVNGETYELDFGGLEDLAEMTKDLGGKSVAVTGVLEVIPPSRSRLEFRPNPWRERPHWYPGRMILHVTGFARREGSHG